MAAYMRQWRKRQRALEEYLRESESDVLPGLENPSDSDMPGTPNSSNSDSNPGILDSFDLPDTDTEYWFTDSENEQTHDEVEVAVTFDDDLRKWAIDHKVTHRALTALLSILRKQGHLLPADARTLLATPHRNSSEEKCGGKYRYYGLEKGICRFLNQTESNCVNLTVNIDGIPLFKSNGMQFWPILAKFGHFDPFIVAMYSGQTKPTDLDEYLKDFLTEYKQLKENGIVFEGRTYNVILEALVCDAPARAFLKCIKGHNSYEACERCVIKGVHSDNRMVFTHDDCASRTDEAFSRVEYINHQTTASPLIDAGLPCVTSFVLDYMHLVCLGVVKRLLIHLVGTKGPRIYRLSARQKEQISQQLVALRGMLPSEFARQPRSIHELDRWKATELRQFLLYTGPVVLQNVLCSARYKHFLSLTVAMSIMLEADDRTRNAYLPYAQDLIKHFVQCCPQLYGNTFSVYNVHGLIHLHEDVSHFKCSLNDISCFPFENYLQKIKKHVRNGRSPLEQVTRRLAEIEHSQLNTAKLHPKAIISVKEKDCCFLLEDQRFAFVRQKNADGTLNCEILDQRDTSPLFQQPCCSKQYLNIVCTRDGGGRKEHRLLREMDLSRKVACLPRGTGYVLLPLRHGLEY